MTRDSLVVTPVPKRHPLHTPRHANDTSDMRHFWGAKNKKQLKVIASAVSDNKDEMYIPDGPKQVENTLEIKDLRGVIATPLP